MLDADSLRILLVIVEHMDEAVALATSVIEIQPEHPGTLRSPTSLLPPSHDSDYFIEPLSENPITLNYGPPAQSITVNDTDTAVPAPSCQIVPDHLNIPHMEASMTAAFMTPESLKPLLERIDDTLTHRVIASVRTLVDNVSSRKR